MKLLLFSQAVTISQESRALSIVVCGGAFFSALGAPLCGLGSILVTIRP